MACYVDDMDAPYGNMRMFHLLADTHEELLAMVDTIGVKRRWIQYPGTPKEHFDICLSKKRLALKAGAQAITWDAAGDIFAARRAAGVAQPACEEVPHA
jgi:hypothetical protein